MDDVPARPYVAPPPAPPGAPDAAPHYDEPLPRPAPPVPPEAPPPRRARWRGALWLILFVAIVAAIVWYATHGQKAAPTGRFSSGGPLPVGTVTVAKGDMPVTLGALGTVTPLATVTVKTQINGQLIEVGFTEGQIVKKGDFLAQIDPRPYQVALAQAQGQLAKDQAALNNAELDLTRYQTLVAQNSVARQTLDTQRATVAQDRGTVIADQAQIDAQKLNLTYAHIVAPVGGRVGLRQVDAGNYVQTSDAGGLVVITQLQPISVIFTLPEDDLRAVLARLHAGATLSATAFDRTGATKLETGTLTTYDNQIDTTTGTVKLRATFDNGALDLFPNQFVNIKLLVDTVKGTELVPDSAIQRGSPGTFVYLVKPDNTVAAQKVKLGPDDGKQVAVLDGLKPGDVVVTDGADRLKDGAKVTLGGTGQGQSPGQSQGQAGAGGEAGPGQAATGPGRTGEGRPGQTPTGPGQPGHAPPSANAPSGQRPPAADTAPSGDQGQDQTPRRERQRSSQ